MTVTVDNADNVVQNVSVLLSNFSISEQREDNFVLIADIYENIGLLITNDEFNVTNNVSKLVLILIDHTGNIVQVVHVLLIHRLELHLKLFV